MTSTQTEGTEPELQALWNQPELADARLFAAISPNSLGEQSASLVEQGLSLPGTDEQLLAWSKQLLGASRDAIAEKVSQVVRDSREAIYQKICVEMKYCELRRSGALDGEDTQVATALIEAVISLGLDLGGLPVFSLTVYLVKRFVLDELCECGTPSQNS